MKKTVFLLAIVGSLSTGNLFFNGVFAEETGKAKQIEDKFKAADKDNDGKLTLDEAKAGMPRVARGFSKIDSENKGYVTVDQIKAMSAQ